MQLDRNNHTEHLRIVYTHLAMKGLQAGSVIAPLFLLARHRSALTVSTLLRGSWNGALIGGISSVIIGGARLYNDSHSKIYSRAYRLLNNVSQNRVDRYSLIGAGITALTAMLMIRRPVRIADKVLGGATFGMIGGMLVHLMYGDLLDKIPIVMIDSLDEAKYALLELKARRNIGI